MNSIATKTNLSQGRVISITSSIFKAVHACSVLSAIQLTGQLFRLSCLEAWTLRHVNYSGDGVNNTSFFCKGIPRSQKKGHVSVLCKSDANFCVSGWLEAPMLGADALICLSSSVMPLNSPSIMSIDLSLDRLRILIAHLPPYTRPTCHIAGTNGKGSVAALISTILQSSPSLKVGRYNSPHLLSIYDCITINNIPVSPTSYNAAHTEVANKDLEKGTKLTSFEMLTLTALRVFEREQVDVAVVEVGMGGRLDATNIIPDKAILVSALTAVDLDHQFFLGDTVGKIATEKAGIARKGRPFVLGFQHAEQVVVSVTKVVDDVGAVLIPAIKVLKRDWDTTIDGPTPQPFSLLSSLLSQSPPPQPIQISLPCFSSPLRALLPLHGAHQLDNLGTALTVINALLTDPSCQQRFNDKITFESVARGIKKTEWPGRLSFHTVHLPPSLNEPQPPPPPFLVLADGAHNPASAKTLGTYITHLLSQTFLSTQQIPEYAQRPKPICIHVNITYILALSHSPPKTPSQTLSPLIPLRIPISTAGFGHIEVSMTVSVALLRFTPPEGMPWIKCVPPTELKAVLSGLIPDNNIWIAPDGPEEKTLENALRWAAAKRKENEREGVEQANLVILAGSLYLVADFYRFLESLWCIWFIQKIHNKKTPSERQIVFILATGIMGKPQNNSRKHESDALRNIGITVIIELLRVAVQHIFQNQHSLYGGGEEIIWVPRIEKKRNVDIPHCQQDLLPWMQIQ